MRRLQFTGRWYDFPDRLFQGFSGIAKPTDDAEGENTFNKSTIKCLEISAADFKGQKILLKEHSLLRLGIQPVGPYVPF